jgi:membrane dipeptidase (peptidase family M19)
MDCCGHVHGSMHRAPMWSPARLSVEAMLAGGVGPAGSTVAARTAESASAALDVLRRSISIDVHSHGGKTGITSKAPPSNDLADAMRAGSLAVACLADVPDLPVLGRSAEGALAVVRAPATGELYRHHLDRLAWMDELVAHHGVRRALSAADLETAHRTGQPAIIGDVEGLDFLDGKLERLEEAHQRGLRHLQLVHYTPNDIGDFQTGTITHDGLTDFGAEVIRACHRLGFVCDVAHATEEMTKQAVKVATTGHKGDDRYCRGRSRQHGHGPIRRTRLRRGLHALGASHRRDAAGRFYVRRDGQDRRRQLPAYFWCCGRLMPYMRQVVTEAHFTAGATTHRSPVPHVFNGG